VKANLRDQQSLLDLGGIDLELIRNSSDKARLLAGSQIEAASAALLELSDRLIDSRNAVSELELELKRAENDLELVEKRIQKDKERLATTSSPKDAQGIEHELESLAKRKDELEDLELSILEQLEKVRADLQKASEQKATAEARLGNLRESMGLETAELDKKRTELSSRRSLIIQTLDPELAVAYQRKADRGLAVGKLTGRECGACRLSITATNLEEIVALPADEIAECPSCQAYLVRT
jgi:uncharacterized protein